MYQREYHRRWYSDPVNAKAKKENAKKHRQLKRERNKQFLLEYKSKHPCVRCGENHPACLDFHHLENKKLDISEMVLRCYGLEAIQDEILKCVVLCKNCHAKEHWAETGV